MGQSVSFPSCKLNQDECTIMKKGTFITNGDIAGIGLVGVISGVTCLAILLSFVCLAMSARKLFPKAVSSRLQTISQRIPRQKFLARVNKRGLTLRRRIIEGIIITVADQQLVLGLAYLVTAKIAMTCSISAYHYNILTGVILLTMATHLSAATVLHRYFQSLSMVILRFLCIAVLQGYIGELLYKRMVEGASYFPTAVPTFKSPREADSSTLMLFFPASCYRDKTTPLVSVGALPTLSNSTAWNGLDYHPGAGNQYQVGFFVWAIMCGAYLISLVINFIEHREIYTRQPENEQAYSNKWVWFYKAFALLVALVITMMQLIYLGQLRGWLDKSGWWAPNEKGENPEEHWRSFGQLLPAFLQLLTVFHIFEIIVDDYHIQKAKERKAGGIGGPGRPFPPHNQRPAYQPIEDGSAYSYLDYKGSSSTLIEELPLLRGDYLPAQTHSPDPFVNPRIQSSRPHSQVGVVTRPKMQVIGSSTTSVAQGVTTGLTGPPKSRAPKPQVAAPSSHTIGMQGQVLVVAPVAVATRPNPAQTASAHGKSTSTHAVVGQTQQTSGVMTRPVMPITQQRPASFHEVPIVVGAKPQQAPRPGSAQATTRPVNQSEIKPQVGQVAAPAPTGRGRGVPPARGIITGRGRGGPPRGGRGGAAPNAQSRSNTPTGQGRGVPANAGQQAQAPPSYVAKTSPQGPG